MNITMNDLVAACSAEPGLPSPLAKMIEAKLPSAWALKFFFQAKAMFEKFTEFNNVRNQLIKDNGVENFKEKVLENGEVKKESLGTYTVVKEKEDFVRSEITAMLEVEIDIDLEPIDATLVAENVLTVKEFGALHFLFKKD